MRDEPGSWIPSFLHLETSWISDFCLSWVSAMARSVPSALLPVLQGTGTPPGAGPRLMALLLPPIPCQDHGTSLGMRVPAWGIPLCPHGPGAAGRILLEQECPHSLWGFLSSGIPHLGEGSAPQGWQGMTGDGERCPTAASGKAFGAQGGHNGVGGATQSERTICGRKYLAELKFLVEDLEFWAELGWDLGRNFGQRLCAGQGEELPCVPCGCHMPGCVPCPSREGGAEEL